MLAPEVLLQVVHKRQRALLIATMELYGDGTNDILNALQELSARIAIATDVEPENFASGFKHHWDHLANAINDSDMMK